MEIISGGRCGSSACPTVFRLESGDLVVQGWELDDSVEIDLPAGESAVRIPAALLANLTIDR